MDRARTTRSAVSRSRASSSAKRSAAFAAAEWSTPTTITPIVSSFSCLAHRSTFPPHTGPPCPIDRRCLAGARHRRDPPWTLGWRVCGTPLRGDTRGGALDPDRLRGASAQELAEFRLSFEADNAWRVAERADNDDVATLEELVAETRRLLEEMTADWTPLTDADASWHEALARATKNRLRIGISLGLHEPRLRQAPALERGARALRPRPASSSAPRPRGS